MSELKDKARQAFRDQQTQDNEGGVPCAVSFVTGYLDGYRECEKLMSEKHEKVLLGEAPGMMFQIKLRDAEIKELEKKLDVAVKKLNECRIALNSISFMGTVKEFVGGIEDTLKETEGE
jgi:hypothetical protein